MANATDLKRGMVIQMDGDLWRVMDSQHITPGNWRGYVQATLRNIRNGSKHEMRFRSTDKVEPAFIEVAEFQYLYSERNLHHFMNTESYEQVMLDDDLMGDARNYVKENAMVKLQLHDGVPVGIELPTSVELLVKETSPGVRGDTVTNTRKDAILETGITVKVPLFIETGERVRVDTRTGEFMERV